jgi:DNA-binding response OmpR family regulator
VGRILCVDDDLKLIQMKRKLLERAGHRVDICTSLDEAIRALHSSVFDAVITDWRLGVDDARQVIVAAKQGKGTRVIVVSGFTSDAFQSSGPQADLYLSKPVDPAELLLILAALLQQPDGLLAPG